MERNVREKYGKRKMMVTQHYLTLCQVASVKRI